MKNLEFGQWKGNTKTALDSENGVLWIQVDLTSKPLASSQGKPMAAKSFLNLTYEGNRIFGNLNLNISQGKSNLREELAEKDRIIAELLAKVNQ